MPSRVKVGFLKKLGAGFVPNATVRDHPPRLLGGWHEFVSSASVLRYLAGTDRPLAGREICHPAGCDIPVANLNGPRKPRREQTAGGIAASPAGNPPTATSFAPRRIG